MFCIFLVSFFLDLSECKVVVASPSNKMGDLVNNEENRANQAKRSFASFRFRPTENTEMIHKAYEIMRNINEIVGENTDYDEAVDEELMAQAKLRALSLLSRIEEQQPYEV